ncbi:hypothetical protein HGRIS_011272 [Hohenbuehelia grisea]|uniref:Transcriptional repressor Tup1 N-terminal domain-containing protein n=1 Tax=Hohenbuehelia grisea TaxID=104357 RepID=A0ABR3JUT5_9AGAR
MSSSTIYAHRSLQPSGPPPPGPSGQHNQARLADSIDAIRQEFDILSQDLAHMRTQRDDYESKLSNQLTELNAFRAQLVELENKHGKVRQQYEDELQRLRQELSISRQNVPPPGGGVGVGVGGGAGAGGLPPHPQAGPGGPLPLTGAGAPPQPPSSMGGIPSGSGPGPGPGQGGPQSYGNDPYYRGDRDRDRERERERERDRERERLVERERMEPRDRERERERGERVPDQRDLKRQKTDRDRMKVDRPDHYSPSLGPGHTPKLQQPSAPGVGPGVPLPHSSYPPAGPGPSSAGGPAGPPPPNSMSEGGGALAPLAPINTGGGMNAGGGGQGGASFPDDLDPHNVPPELKKEASDWFAVFNPKVKRVLDVNLVHTLMHESVVCCVRFSADGKYLATGCNRTAQIFDTKTGMKTCVLVDEAAAKAGDLYIRSVCFSPDGKFLATGAEDKQIRIWDIAKKAIRMVFDGHQQEIYSLDFSSDGRLIVSGSGDKTARIWDMVDGSSKVLTINDQDSINNDAGVTSVAMSPDGRFVAAGSLDTVVRIWDVATGLLVERLRGHRDSVYSVAFTPDGKGLVSGSLDKTLKYWDVSGLNGGRGAAGAVGVKGRKEGANGGPVNGPAALRKDGEKGSPCTMNFTGHKDYVLSVAVSHDGQWVVSGSKDRGVQFWDSRTAIVQCMLQGHKNSGMCSFWGARFLAALVLRGGVGLDGDTDWVPFFVAFFLCRPRLARHRLAYNRHRHCDTPWC